MQRSLRSDSPSEATRIEEARIRAAYAKRHNDNVRYSCFNRAQLFMIQERERQILSSLQQHGFERLAKKSILEIGCGTGYWIREFIKWEARPENITGVDLLVDRVAEARQLCPPSVKVECRSAVDLAFPSATFDLVLQSTSLYLDSRCRREATDRLGDAQGGKANWADYLV